MRMFTAVLPPDDVIEDLDEFLASRREADAAGDRPLRWTMPYQWHITLGFMPQVPVRALDDLLERLTRAGRRRTPFALRIAGGGAFPGPARAKVLYAGIEATADAAEELGRLSAGARAAASKAGADAGGGPFTPHVTLARSGRPFEATRLMRVLDTYRSREFLVEEFVLVESHLGEGPRNRPRYDVVARFALGDEGAAGGPSYESG